MRKKKGLDFNSYLTKSNDWVAMLLRQERIFHFNWSVRPCIGARNRCIWAQRSYRYYLICICPFVIFFKWYQQNDSIRKIVDCRCSRVSCPCIRICLNLCVNNEITGKLQNGVHIHFTIECFTVFLTLSLAAALCSFISHLFDCASALNSSNNRFNACNGSSV